MPINRRTRTAATLTANGRGGVVQIVGSNHTFFLREPIHLDIHAEDGHIVVEYAPLNLSVYGDTHEDASFAFAELFETVWEQIAESPDRLLTGDACDLKAAFRRHVERTE